MMIGRNALYFEDYVLAIQYFNQIIKTKPYQAEPYYYRAIAKYFLDDFKGAEEDCTLSIERNPFIYGAYQLRADSRQNQKNFIGAEEDYEISLKLNPNDKLILINLGIVNIENKNYDKADKYLNDLIQIYPNFTEGILVQANLDLQRQDTLKAIENIDLAITKDNYFAPAYSMRASIKLAQKHYVEAITDYDKSIELDPSITINYINRGLAKYYNDDLRGAMSDYDLVITNEPNNLIAHFNRALLRAQVGDDNRAIEDFNFVISKEKDNYIAFMNRALLKTNIGDYNGALKDLNIVLDQYPNFYQGYRFRADIKRKQNNIQGAEQDYFLATKIEKKIRQDILAGNMPRGVDKDTKTREESDQTIDKFNLLVVADKEDREKNQYKNEARGKVQNKQVDTSLKPIFVTSYYEGENSIQKFVHYNAEVEKINTQKELAQKLVITNHEVQLDSMQIELHFESVNAISKKIENEPNNILLYFARSLDYMLIQDYNSAIEDLNHLLTINPDWTLAYFNLAVSYDKLLRAKHNNPGLYKEYNINDTQAPAYVNNGLINKNISTVDNITQILVSKLEYDQIITSYDKVIALAPNFIYAYYNRASIKIMQKDFRGAILDYNEAIRIDPDFADAYYNRGLTRLRIKDNQRGLDDLRKAGELGVLDAYSIIKKITE